MGPDALREDLRRRLGSIAPGLTAENAPCEAMSCTWKVDAWYRNGTTEAWVKTLGSSAGAGEFTKHPTGSSSLRDVTHLRA